jgi:hypothetical protein
MSANAVWKDLERERARHAPVQPISPELPAPVTDAEEITRSSARNELIPVEVPFNLGLQLIRSTKPRPKRKHAPLWPTGHGEQMRLLG